MVTVSNLIFSYCFRLMRDWKQEAISAIPFRMEKEDYLRKQCTIFERISRKIVSFDFQLRFLDFLAKWYAPHTEKFLVLTLIRVKRQEFNFYLNLILNCNIHILVCLSGNLLATVATQDSHGKTLANACISSTDFCVGSALTS